MSMINSLGAIVALCVYCSGCLSESEPTSLQTGSSASRGRKQVADPDVSIRMDTGLQLQSRAGARYVVYEPSGMEGDPRPVFTLDAGDAAADAMTLIVNDPVITSAQTSYGITDPRLKSSQPASVQVDVTFGGSQHVATDGEVGLSFSKGRKFSGQFALTASNELDVRRPVEGSFTGTWTLSCFKLVADDPTGTGFSPGPGVAKEPRPQWQSDAAFDSAFCAALFGRGDSI